MHLLEKDTEFNKPKYGECMVIDKGMALVQSLVGLPSTFGDLAVKVLCLFPPSKTVNFISDSYRAVSIEASESTLHGQLETFLLKGPAAKIPKEWKTFPSNNRNKIYLVELILSEWKKKKNAQSFLTGKSW